MIKANLILVSLVLAGGVSAQLQELQATAGHHTSDAPGFLWVSGFKEDGSTQQLIIDASLLTPMVGKTISSISFRRDVADPVPLVGSSVSFEVCVSTCRTSVRSPSETLALNHGVNRLVVFSGQLQLPSSPAYTGGSLWAPSNRVRVPFSSGFSYSGGDLCLEFSSALPNSYSQNSWAVDAVFSHEEGTVVAVGDSVAPVRAVVGSGGVKETSGALTRDLVAGGTGVFFAYGTPGANAFFLIGTKFLPQPLNLALVNSPQSNVLIEPVASFSSTFGPLSSPHVAAYGGQAIAEFLLPADPSFLGAVLTAQWIEYDLSIPRFFTSNAIRAQVASTLPSVMMSLISGTKGPQGQPPVTGKVDVGIGHVIKFEYQ